MEAQVPDQIFRERDLLRSSQEIIALNVRLRRDGYYHLPWFARFLAVGSDPGGCVYYFDLGRSGPPVFLADHDFHNVADYRDLAPDPGGFAIFLRDLAQR